MLESGLNNTSNNHPLKGSRRGLLRHFSLAALLVLCLGASFIFAMRAGGERKPVIVQTCYVRDSQMRVVGTLRRDETFEIHRAALSGYVRGFAFGQVNQTGYVKRSCLAR